MRWLRNHRSVLVIAIFAIASTVASCGAGSKLAGGAVNCDVDAPGQPVTVQVLAYSAPPLDPFTNAMAHGCSKVGNLAVRHGPIDFGAQLEKAQLSLSQSGEGSYDIVEVFGGTLPQYAAKGWLQPLDSLVESSGTRYDIHSIDPRFREALTYEGKLYALPFGVNVHLMVYRKDLLDSLGITPPRTFDELSAAAMKIKASGKVAHPLALTYGADSAIGAAFNNSLTSLGGEWTNPTTNKPQLTSATAIAAIESLRRLKPFLDPDVMTFDQSQVQSQLQNGRAAIGILYSGRGAQFMDATQSKHAGKFGFAPPPSVRPGGGPWATLNVDGFAVAKNSPVPKDLLFQIAAVGTSELAAEAAGTVMFPARIAILKKPGVLSKVPYWKAVDSTLKQGVRPYPKKGYFTPMQTAVTPFLAAAVSGRTPVREAMHQAQTAAEAVIGQLAKSRS